jgi:uncharacterized protein involved in exopolysaccharide biosynthesis
MDDQAAGLFDYPELWNYAGFVLRAPRRHPWLAASVWLAVVAAAVVALMLLPKRYHVESQILAQRNQVIAALGNPGRAIPWDADAPTRAAPEIILRRENLVAIIKQTGLMDRWDSGRAPAQRVKDAIMRVVHGPLTDQEKLDGLIGTLEKKLTVWTGDGTVSIAINWTDPQMAYRLVEAAQQNFLETRHVSELAAISEAISILQEHANEARDEVARLTEELQKNPHTPAHAAVRAPRPATPRPVSPELLEMKAMIRAKQSNIQELEAFRQKRLAELQAQLAQEKTIYAEAHPNVRALQDSIAALAHESPQLAALREDEKRLRLDYVTRGGHPEDLETDRTPATERLNPQETTVLAMASPGDDPSTDYMRGRLRSVSAKYASFLDRIDSAQIELDTARAAFKYRYTVSRPAQLPKAPNAPTPIAIVLAAALAGLVLAVLVPAARDIYAGVLVESWQIEQQLNLPVLGEVQRVA